MNNSMTKLNKRWTAHCNLVLGATGMILMTIAGCGGGGGGSRRAAVPTPGPTNIPSAEPQPTATPTPIPTPAPTPTPSPDGTCPINPNGYLPNYAAPLLAGFDDPKDPSVPPQPPGNLLRHAGFALKVYFQVNEFLTDARRAYAIQGMNQWVTGTNNRVRYNVITDKTQADIVIEFSPYTAEDNNVLGRAQLVWDTSNNILFPFSQDPRPDITDDKRAGHILLNYTNDLALDTATASHEFGHSLGIGGHSPSDLDKMYYANSTTNRGPLTPSDINTLRTAYCDNFPQTNASTKRSIRSRGPVRTLTISDTFEDITHSHHK